MMSGSANPARRRLSAVLNREVPVVLVLGGVAWVAPGITSDVAGWVMVGVLVATPLGRIAWLAARWMQFDRTYAWAGWGLLAVVVAAAVVAVLLR